ncbi:small G protein signaling modulator 1-like [Halichondria panicea]|uniref:small G protein signaling modulator 1-like n=1 Tax=Halichondria panicea TaxID=6063 RepID=UPI00312BC55D
MAGKHNEELIQQCKAETNKLLELAVSKKAIFWAHPTFSSFCVSVEDILSYRIKCRFASMVPSKSLRILQELSSSCTEAQDVYTECCRPSSQIEDDYARVRDSFSVDKKILWIRMAILEGKLAAILEKLVANSRLYYKSSSVLCHPEYCQIFLILLDGPCSIRYNTKYGYLVTLPQSELISRHLKVLSVSLDKDIVDGMSVPSTNKAWQHIQSLYQSNSSQCLFGKNNILVKPVGVDSLIRGYLTLQFTLGIQKLRWIPNCLLSDSAHVKTGLWDHVIAVDVIQDISHIHIHKVQGYMAEMVLIGSDGIPLPTLFFPHHSSVVLLLECLEDSCYPQRCLDPPLTYRSKTHKSEKFPPLSNCFSSYTSCTSTSQCEPFSPFSCCSDDQDESWLNDSRNCKHVFRIMHMYEKDLSAKKLTQVARHSSFRKCNMSWHIKARCFQSWLSHSRYLRKVHQKLSHLVSPTPLLLGDDVVNRKTPLSEKEWLDFCKLTPSDRRDKWNSILTIVYLLGIEHEIRSQVWPYLLGVFPITSSEQEREKILSNIICSYNKSIQAWKGVEIAHRKQKLRTESQQSSPSLSIISPPPSPRCIDDMHAPSGNEADDIAQLPKHLENDIEQLVSCDFVDSGSELDAKGLSFIEELEAIDKDVPRCDRNYWYFKSPENLLNLRNIICTYVWEHLSDGYSQGMCDLLAPLLIILDDETLTFACYLRLMEQMENVDIRLANVQALLQVMEPLYYDHLTQHSRDNDSRDLLCMYCFRWLAVLFKREFSYDSIFRIWESVWSAGLIVSKHFEEFVALAVFLQFKTAILDADLNPSDILSLFNSYSAKLEIDCAETLKIAMLVVSKLQEDLAH